MDKHTPGPYQISGSVMATIQGTNDLLVVAGNENTISPILCTVHSDGGRLSAFANARLFKEAPNLLEKLEACVFTLGMYIAHNGEFPEKSKTLTEAVAAIAQAKGEA